MEADIEGAERTVEEANGSVASHQSELKKLDDQLSKKQVLQTNPLPRKLSYILLGGVRRS
jgi:uncharacterized coiled-coil protein SlyX